MLNQQQIEEAIQYVKKDPFISVNERNEIATELKQPGVISNLFGGAAGAAFANSIAKFLKLDKKLKTIVTLAGAGLGVLFVQHRAENKKTYGVSYKKDQKAYEIE